MRLARRILVLAFLSAAALPARAADVERDWTSLAAGFDYTSGNYGESDSTSILYLPVTGKYHTGPWTLGVTVPYIEVSGPGNVIRDIGREKKAPGARHTESGLGDIIGSVTFNALTTQSGGALDFTGKVKLGTADRNKGLGTGEDDVYVQADAYLPPINATIPFGTIGYKFLGSPPGVDLRDVVYGAVGFQHALSPQRSIGLSWYGQEAPVVGGDPQSELTGFLNQRLSADWKAQAYAVLGLAKGSPDFGIGALFTRKF